MIGDLPRDLAERVLSRLPVTSLRGMRSTCKKWNKISKDRSFTKRHIREAKAAAKKKKRKEFQVVMMLDFRVYLFNVNLINLSIERTCKLISLTGDIDISEIFQCNGLVLCVTKDKSRLVVWNPCSGQTRWIEPPRNSSSYHRLDRYALGYERKHKYSLRSHKVLRFVDDYDLRLKRLIREFEIYNINSNSWKVVDDVNPDWDIEFFQRGLSLKGNTYWYAQEKLPVPENLPTDGPPSEISDLPDFLIGFDFTTERFGPRLPLPFHAFFEDTVTLSSVREKQLAVLCQKLGSPQETLKIWITTKIEPNAVSWSKFLSVDMKPLTGFQFLVEGGSFFLDEKKKVAVVLDKDRARTAPLRNIAYIIGKKGFFKQVDLGESKDRDCWPLVCSYLPSSVQIKQP